MRPFFLLVSSVMLTQLEFWQCFGHSLLDTRVEKCVREKIVIHSPLQVFTTPLIFFLFSLLSLDCSSERRREPGRSDEVISRGTAAEVGKLSPGECGMQQSQQLQLWHQGMRNTDQQQQNSSSAPKSLSSKQGLCTETIQTAGTALLNTYSWVHKIILVGFTFPLSTIPPPLNLPVITASPSTPNAWERNGCWLWAGHTDSTHCIFSSLPLLLSSFLNVLKCLLTWLWFGKGWTLPRHVTRCRGRGWDSSIWSFLQYSTWVICSSAPTLQ